MTPAKAHPYIVSFSRIGLIEQDETTGRYEIGALARAIKIFQEAMERNRGLASQVSDESAARQQRSRHIEASVEEFRGAIGAVLLEFADARIRSGVWDHSTYKADPIGRSRRTGIAAMVGVYGPQSAARRVIQGVNNMHARVAGHTPGGEAYSARDPDLLDWVSATAAYGFVTAYDRFVAPLRPADQARYWREGSGLARLYGVTRAPRSTDDFLAMMEALLAFKRAGADGVLSYFALDAARLLRKA